MKYTHVTPESLSKSKKSVVIPNMNIIFRAILIIFCSILVSNIIKNVFSGSSVTFTGFLEFIGSVPQISTNLSLNTIYITGDWAILDGLRVFLNYLIMPLNVVIFLSKNLWNCLLYIVYFLRFLFV